MLHESTNKYRRIKQGDTFSPKMFTMVLEYAFKNINCDKKGINVDGEYLNHLRFADNIVIISDNLSDAQKIFRDLNQPSKGIGLDINL